MPNICMGMLGTGHYPEDVFEQKIYDQGIDQDWWIEDSNFKELIHDLQEVNFQVERFRYRVSFLIDGVDKDLPADPGVRFPGARGVLGSSSYQPLRFACVPQSLKAHFVALINMANQVDPRPVMANQVNPRPVLDKRRPVIARRPCQPIVAGGSGTNTAGGLNTHDQLLRDGALNYGHTLKIIATTVVKTYNRGKFEREFGLTWIPNPGGGAAS